MSVSEFAGIAGLILGVIGTTLGIFNYFRDRARLVVRLQWDLTLSDDQGQKTIGCITVTNTGRRAIYMSHVALRLPKGEEISHFLIQGGLKGQKLSEGDAPAVFPVDQSGLDRYAGQWKEIRAQVSDSTGKEWLSTKVPTAPSWAKLPDLSSGHKSTERPST